MFMATASCPSVVNHVPMACAWTIPSSLNLLQSPRTLAFVAAVGAGVLTYFLKASRKRSALMLVWLSSSTQLAWAVDRLAGGVTSLSFLAASLGSTTYRSNSPRKRFRSLATFAACCAFLRLSIASTATLTPGATSDEYFTTAALSPEDAPEAALSVCPPQPLAVKTTTANAHRTSRVLRMTPSLGKPRLCRRAPLSLIHISEPTRLGMISYAVFCLK